MQVAGAALPDHRRRGADDPSLLSRAPPQHPRHSGCPLRNGEFVTKFDSTRRLKQLSPSLLVYEDYKNLVMFFNVFFQRSQTLPSIQLDQLPDPNVSQELSLPVAAEIPFAQQRAAPSPTKAIGPARVSPNILVISGVLFAMVIIFNLRILVYLVVCDSWWVSLEHLLLSWCSSQRST